jgi:hypothetical protein
MPTIFLPNIFLPITLPWDGQPECLVKSQFLGLIVIPAQAGIQFSMLWIPACAGMTDPYS